MGAEVARIVRLLEKTYDKQPWYGPSLLEVLRNMPSAVATLRHGNTHSIVEIVRHMTSWRTFATRRLQGDMEFEVAGEDNFPQAGSWDDALSQFEKSQITLLEAARAFPDERLSELVPSKSHRYTFYTLLHGIIQHDIYHLGQIAYIKRSADRP